MTTPYNLKYKTIDALSADVKSDMKSFDVDNMIEPQDLIRAARYVTKDLGLKLHMTKEAILSVDYNKAKLPLNFHFFNYGLLCTCKETCQVIPGGTQIIETPYPIYQVAPDAPSACSTSSSDTTSPRIIVNCKGEVFEITQVLRTETIKYSKILPLKLVNSTPVLDCYCPNLYFECDNEIKIEGGYLKTNFKCGDVYINYQADLEDDDGNVLVPDHDIITRYYEYALKDKILENLLMNGEDVERLIDRNNVRLKHARYEAWTTVRTPDFEEMKKVHLLNRQAYNHRYVNMFKDYNWYGQVR
jgi:hypothetical protein